MEKQSADLEKVLIEARENLRDVKYNCLSCEFCFPVEALKALKK